jgi:hypothetical protein
MEWSNLSLVTSVTSSQSMWDSSGTEVALLEPLCGLANYGEMDPTAGQHEELGSSLLCLRKLGLLVSPAS